MKSFNYYDKKTQLYTLGECLCSKSVYTFSDIQEFLNILKTNGIPEPKYIVMRFYEQEEKFIDYMNEFGSSGYKVYVGDITDICGLQVVRMYDLYRVCVARQIRNIEKELEELGELRESDK